MGMDAVAVANWQEWLRSPEESFMLIAGTLPSRGRTVVGYLGPDFQPSQRYRLLTWADGPGWNRGGPLALCGGWDSTSMEKAVGLWCPGRAFSPRNAMDSLPGPLAQAGIGAGRWPFAEGAFCTGEVVIPAMIGDLQERVPPTEGYRCDSCSAGCTRIVWLERDALFCTCAGMLVGCMVSVRVLHSGPGFAGAFEELADQWGLIRCQPGGSHRQRGRGRG